MCRVTSCNDFELHPGDLNPQQSDKVTVDRRVEEKGMSRALSLDLVNIDVGPQIQYSIVNVLIFITTTTQRSVVKLYTSYIMPSKFSLLVESLPFKSGCQRNQGRTRIHPVFGREWCWGAQLLEVDSKPMELGFSVIVLQC